MPIVVGLSIFDLLMAEPGVRPAADDGYAACQAASRRPGDRHGRCGTSATVGGGEATPPSRGIGGASVTQGDPWSGR